MHFSIDFETSFINLSTVSFFSSIALGLTNNPACVKPSFPVNSLYNSWTEIDVILGFFNLAADIAGSAHKTIAFASVTSNVCVSAASATYSMLAGAQFLPFNT